MAIHYPRMSSVCPRTGSEVEEDGVGRVSDAASLVKNFIIVSSLRSVSYFSIKDEVISAEKE